MSEELEIESLRKELENNDVAQKRYLMYQIFDMILEKIYKENGVELPPEAERVEELNGLNGYMYKLSQDFLMSSSTMEKERKLDKMVERLARGMGGSGSSETGK